MVTYLVYVDNGKSMEYPFIVRGGRKREAIMKWSRYHRLPIYQTAHDGECEPNRFMYFGKEVKVVTNSKTLDLMELSNQDIRTYNKKQVIKHAA